MTARALAAASVLILVGCGDGTKDAIGSTTSSTKVGHDHDPLAEDHADHESDGTACNGELRDRDGIAECWMTSGGTANGADAEQEYFVSVSALGYGPIAAEDEAKAKSFAAQVEAAIEPYRDIRAAEKAGWTWGSIGVKLAYFNLDSANRFLADMEKKPFLDHISNEKCANDTLALDPKCPEFLMYLTDGTDYRLLGAMFYMPFDTDGRQFAGRASIWHFHANENLCYADNGLALFIQPIKDGDPNTKLPCPAGKTRARSPQMMHAWLADTGRSPLTGDMVIDDLTLGEDGIDAPYLSTVYSEIWNLQPATDGSNTFQVLDPNTATPPSGPSGG